MYSHLVSVAACCALAGGTTNLLEAPPTAHPAKKTAATPKLRSLLIWTSEESL
ncbi:MAG TPA: hypothetical protein VNW92_15375 [Polyangiaceae bacterium]|nr:hypothetical protein [Polyangiaceae bacterium]